MNTSGGNLRFSRSFREGMGVFLEVRNLAILLAVPVLIALATLVEARLELRGVIGPYGRNHSLRMMLWNVAIVVSLVALVKGCLGFQRIWHCGKATAQRGRVGTYLGGVSSLFIVYFGVACIMGIAVMMATGGFHPSGLLFLVGWCTPPLIWSVCLAAVLSLLTEGPAAAWLGAAIFNLALVPGLFGKNVPQLIVPPMGRLITTTVNGFFRPEMLLSVLFHASLYLALGALVFLLRCRESSRRWQ